MRASLGAFISFLAKTGEHCDVKKYDWSGSLHKLFHLNLVIFNGLKSCKT